MKGSLSSRGKDLLRPCRMDLSVGEGLRRFDPDRADFEFSGLGDGVVAGAGEDVDVGLGEAEAGEDGSAW